MRRRRALAPFAIFILPFGAVVPSVVHPAGIALLHLANIGRVVVLTRIQATSPDWLEFNHDYTFTVLIYGLVFALWHLWTVWGRTSHRPGFAPAKDLETDSATDTNATS